MGNKNKTLKIDMCAGSELMDTQGETLSVEGADITDLISGNGRVNDNHGKGAFNCLGRVTGAKKIFKAEDCENDRHKYYWEKIKAPYIYAEAELFNNEDHPNARAAAAILKNIHREDIPLKMKASVEGGVLSRGITDPTRLARTKIHSIALTFCPANNATLVEPINLDKSCSSWDSDKQLIKSVLHLAETNIPSFRHIERHASANTIHDNLLKIQELAKNVGIEVEIRQPTPDIIAQQAVVHKIVGNVRKVNETIKKLSKAAKNYQTVMNPTKLNRPEQTPVSAPAPMADTATLTSKDKFEQGIGKLKTDLVPTAPKEISPLKADAMKVKSPAQIKNQNVVKRLASKAMKDASHLDAIKGDLTSRGISDVKIQKIIDHIQSHMVKSVENLDQTLFKECLTKALMAGYGGAGVPTNATGGSVMQTQSIESKNKKIKKKLKNALLSKSMEYITCYECGNEQVYMNHQVKCRNCGHNFDLFSLQKYI
jgi:ribosomal protein S27E